MPQARFRLRDRDLGLAQASVRLGRLEHDQRVARPDGLALDDRNQAHGADDLRADVDAKRRRDTAARHHGLHQIAAHHAGHLDRARAQQPRSDRREGNGDYDAKKDPSPH